METYSPEIIKAYNNWMEKIGNEPDEPYQDGYKAKMAASKRAGDKFEKLCISAGLNYCNVARDLQPRTITSIAQ